MLRVTMRMSLHPLPVDVEAPPVALAVPPVAETTTVMLLPPPAMLSRMASWLDSLPRMAPRPVKMRGMLRRMRGAESS